MSYEMDCWLCEAEFKADEYGEGNECPNCGQRYGYDEGQMIVLTSSQLELLKLGREQSTLIGIDPAKGYQLVPIEPTDAMKKAAWDTHYCNNEGALTLYKAMLKAAGDQDEN